MTLTAEPKQLPSRNVYGAGAFTLGTACLVANDTIVKLASVDLPIGQLIFVRGWFAVGLVLAVCAWKMPLVRNLAI